MKLETMMQSFFDLRGVPSVIKDNFEDLDMDSFEDLISPLNNALGQAEFLAYSANFNEFSSAKPAGLVLMYSCT